MDLVRRAVTGSLALLLWSAAALWAAPQGWKEIDPQELQAMMQGSDPPILINVMSKLECMDHRIVGSMCLPAEAIGSGSQALPQDKRKAIVFYCESDRCFRSNLAAERAVTLGHTRVFVLKKGLPGWKQAGYGTESLERVPRFSIPSLKVKQLPKWQKEAKGAVVVDVRTEVLFRRDHIPDAINLPMYLLEERYKELPMERDILVVDETGYNSFIAASYLMSRGYTKVHRLFGGMEEWRSSQKGAEKRPRGDR